MNYNQNCFHTGLIAGSCLTVSSILLGKMVKMILDFNGYLKESE